VIEPRHDVGRGQFGPRRRYSQPRVAELCKGAPLGRESRRGEKFLHTPKLARPETYQKRLELFAQALAFHASEALTQAKSRLAVTRARQLRVLQAQLDDYRQQIEKLFAQHPDHDLFGSLPGTGPKLAPRLLAELGDDRLRFDSPQALPCDGGTAPVSYQSGPVHKVRVRHHCNPALKHTLYLWAHLSRSSCPWAETYYQTLRQRGKSHACALRCLGQRWLKILWKMWQTRTCYEAELHQKNQLRHGSWVLKRQNASPATPYVNNFTQNSSCKPENILCSPYPAPVPFNYPPPILQETSGKTEEPGFEEGGGDDPADWWKGEATPDII
jgi:Transposase IS116/IS110/IS902 family